MTKLNIKHNGKNIFPILKYYIPYKKVNLKTNNFIVLLLINKLHMLLSVILKVM